MPARNGAVESGTGYQQLLRPSDRVMNLAAILLFAAVLFAVYSRVANAPFVHDDELTIKLNSSLTRLWPLWGDSSHPGPLNPAKNFPTAGRPLVNLSLALNYRWSGLNPSGYRVANLLIHYASALILMIIVRRTLRLPYFGGRFPAAATLAFVTGLLWAAHPLQTEVIAYITQRTELLMAFFYLVTLYSALRYWDSALPKTRAAWLTIAIVICAAGMASKEVMVSAPLVVLMFEWTFIRRSFRDVMRESWPLYLGLAATWVLLIALNISGPRSNSAGFHLDLSPFVWWATQAKVLWIYLKLAIWPWPLVIYYEMPYLTTWSAAAPWLLLTAALLIGSLFLLWRRYAAGFVLTSMFVILAPTSIVPIASEVAAERRMYLALAGLIALAIAGGYQFAKAWLASSVATREASDRKSLVMLATFSAVLIVGASLVSALRLAAYADTVTLWQDVLLHQPNNYLATYNLASYFYAHDQFEKALPYYERGLMLHPNDLRARNSYSQTLLRVGRTSEAIRQLEQLVRLYPSYFPAYVDLTKAYIHENRMSDATNVANRALQLARSAGQTNAVAQIEEFLNDLKARQVGPKVSF